MATFNIGLMLRIGGEDVVLESLTPISKLKEEFKAELPPGKTIALPRFDEQSIQSFEGAVQSLLDTIGIKQTFSLGLTPADMPDFFQKVMDEIAHVEIKITRFSIHRFIDPADKTRKKHKLNYDMAIALGTDAEYGKVGPFKLNGLSLRIRNDGDDDASTTSSNVTPAAGPN